jgi:hypothetical protein
MSEDTENNSAYDKIGITLPKFKKWSQSTYYDYSTQVVDYDSLDQLNSSITAARLALFKVAEMINNYERLEKESKLNYERSHRRAYLASTEKTDTARKARADLQCEDLENEWLMNEQVRIELTRMSNSLRIDLQTLSAVGNNIRQQLKME